jgi:hypothetical protein
VSPGQLKHRFGSQTHIVTGLKVGSPPFNRSPHLRVLPGKVLARARCRRRTRLVIHVDSRPRLSTSSSALVLQHHSHVRMQTRSSGTSVEAQNLQVIVGVKEEPPD